MKFILLAATAMIATPLMAQDMSTQTPPAGQTAPAPTDGTMTPPPADQTTAPTDPATTTTPPTDQTMSGGTMAPAQTTDTSGAAPMAAGDPNMADPAGGYQPSQPATSGTPAPGATVRFQPAADPNTAYPPPAPLAKYPICKKGQYDNCMQRGGR